MITHPETKNDEQFAAWMKLAFPWLNPVGADYRNLRAAWQAGFKAGQEASNAGP